MAGNHENEEGRREEQQDLVEQQQDLFSELSREQADAEKALEDEQEQSAAGKHQDERDD